MSITYNEIQALYLGLLDRPADASGENYWYSQTGSASSTANTIGTYAKYSPTDNGQSLTAITSSNITNEITNIYTNLLGVTPSVGNSGVAYWAGLYTTGTLSIGQIVDSIFNIVENLSSGSPYINEKTYMDKAIAAATSYTQANANVTYNAAAYLAEGQTIITTPVMQSVNLTTAIDNIAPVGNTNIYGTLGTNTGAPGTGTDTLNPLDTIKATGSNNVLNITDQGESTILAGDPLTPTSDAGTFNFSTVNVSGVQTANITSVVGESDLNVAGWTGLTALNVTTTDSTINPTGNSENVTAPSTTAVTVTDTLTTTTAAATTTISGGSTVNLTETATASSDTIGDINIGETTGNSSGANPTGAVSVTATETLTGTGVAGNISVSGGTTQTINSTVNASINPTFQATITASSAAGAVVINDNTVATADKSISNSDIVEVKGGTTITVNENLTANATLAASIAAATASPVTVTGGNVYISGSATTTAVTVTQTAAVAPSPGAVAVPAGAGSPAVPAQPGFNAVAAGAITSATAVVPGTLGVTDGNVYITDPTGVITTVTLNNYGNSLYSSTVGGSLATVNLSGTAGTLEIKEAAATATALTLNLNGVTPDQSAEDAIEIDDEGNKITTLNVVAGATASTLTGLTDTSSALTSLNVSGNSVVTITTLDTPNITTLNVTGAAGFTGNISETGITAFDPTSTGVITTTLNATTQTFTGGAGQDIVTINEDATKAITGGTATNNEIILEGGVTYTAANTGTNVTGFSILGVGSVGSSSTVTVGSTTNTVDMSVLSGTYDALVVYGSGMSETFTNVAAGTSLALIGGDDTIVYTVAGASGPTDTVGITLGTASSTSTTTSLTLADSNDVGIGTVNVVSNASSSSLSNTISALTDDGLAKLTVSGAAGLTINALTELSTQATAMTINNNSAGTVAIGTLTDENLGSLTFTGTGLSSVTNLIDSTSQFVSISNNGTGGTVNVKTLTDAALTHLSFAGTGAVDVQTILDVVAPTLTIANTGTGAATVGDGSPTGFADPDLTSLTLTGNVAIGQNKLSTGDGGGTPIQASATGENTGVTISGSTDNAHINIYLTGAAAGSTDSITLGNGNDYITDGSTAGTVNVTVGTGSNLIVLGATSDTTGSYAVTLGAHTPTSSLYDSISVGAQTVSSESSYLPTAANLVVTGAVGYSATAGDVINFNADNLVASSGSTTQIDGVSGTLKVLAPITASSTLASTISTLESAVSAHADDVAFSVFDGNTYVAEANNATAPSASNESAITLIELVGTHTFAASTTVNHLVVI
jgi:hypothetical protein